MKKLQKKSIYEYLEKELKLKISYSQREIKFRKSTEEEKSYINLENIDIENIIGSEMKQIIETRLQNHYLRRTERF